MLYEAGTIVNHILEGKISSERLREAVQGQGAVYGMARTYTQVVWMEVLHFVTFLSPVSLLWKSNFCGHPQSQGFAELITKISTRIL